MTVSELIVELQKMPGDLPAVDQLGDLITKVDLIPYAIYYDDHGSHAGTIVEVVSIP